MEPNSLIRSLAGSLYPHNQLEVIARVNETEVPSLPCRLFDGFLEQAMLRPDHPAVIAAGRTLSYADLEKLSASAAAALVRRGVRAGQPVAILLEKGWQQVVAALAVVRSGGAYLPVDPDLPVERRNHLLAQSGVSFALIHSGIFHEAWPEVVAALDFQSCISSKEVDVTLPDPSPGSLAYIIYTSGSTGQPKGVMISHQAAVNTIGDVNRRFSVQPDDRLLGLSALSFDLSVYDIFGTLWAGATLVLPSPQQRLDPQAWCSLLRDHAVSLWNSVPALLEILVEYLEFHPEAKPALAKLRLAMLSGDWLPVPLPGRLLALAGACDVINLGGATEAAIWSVLHRVLPEDAEQKSIPYGKPMANQRLYILNEQMRLCPFWVKGRIFIAGEGLALGYWQEEDRTNASFVQHPSTQERLYLTGDLGRYLPDGEIQLLGREDFQFKLHGHRIEPAEIENALLLNPAVRAAAVVLTQSQPARIAAFLVGDGSPDPVTGDELRHFLSHRLPQPVIPSTYEWLSALPLTANGKVDRGALARRPAPTSTVSEATVNQSSDTVIDLCREISQLLGGKTVQPGDTLIELGMDSVQLLQLANRLEARFGNRPSLEMLFENPTVGSLLQHGMQVGGRGTMSPIPSRRTARTTL